MDRDVRSDWTDEEVAFAAALGKRLRMLRRLTRKETEAIAELAGLTPAQVHHAESGTPDIPTAHLRRIGRALGISDWTAVLRVAEHQAAGTPATVASTVPLHVHVEIRDENAVAAALTALMTAALTDADRHL